MKTRKLYYEDCNLREFSAKVLWCEQAQTHWQVELEATAFYPTGGGQACDTGTLGDAQVLEVQETEGRILHLCDRPLPVGETVTGKICWQRRFDLMQQHTGEHILSGLIYAAYGYHNTGFHVGKDCMEVDFDGIIPPEALPQLEEKANAAVWENLPLHCWVPEAGALSQEFYRTKRKLDWPVRLVQIPGVDSCACCGVHVAHTGQVGLIKILSCVKFHGGVRLEVVCGRRAYAYICRITEQNRQVSREFSAMPLETGAAAVRIRQQLAEEKYRSTGLEKQLFAAIAAGYRGGGDVCHFTEGVEGAALRELAMAIESTCGGTAAVFSGTDSRGYQLCLAGADAKTLGVLLTEKLQARGGGRPGFFQGSVQATRQQIEGVL